MESVSLLKDSDVFLESVKVCESFMIIILYVDGIIMLM